VSVEQSTAASRFTALRNLFYAWQWWLFGGFSVFLWWRHLRDQRSPGGLELADDTVRSTP
jgi:surfeit locus 1 family protein